MLQSSIKTIVKLANFQLSVSKEAFQLTKKLVKGSFDIALEGGKDIRASFQQDTDKSSEVVSLFKKGKQTIQKRLQKDDILN